MDIRGIDDNFIINNIKEAKNRTADGSFEKRLIAAMDKKDEKELKKACQDFEGLFLNMLYRQMKASVPKSELIPGDMGRSIFESMLDEELMEEASKARGTGLADMLYKQLSKQMKSLYKTSDGGEAEVVD